MAASTITRDAWTNDTGTAANPNEDGTILNNSVLQNHIYARVDEMFAGAGSYTTFTLGGRLAVEGTGTNSFSGSLSGTNTVNVRNTLAGTANQAEFALGNDATTHAAYFRITSTSFTPTSIYKADAAHIECIRAGGLVIGATHASGVINFYTGGTTERARMDTTGVFSVVGTSAQIRLVDAISATRGIAFDIATASVSKIATIGSDSLRLRTGGQDVVYIGNPDGTVTQGVLIDQGGADDICLGMTSTVDVAHGMTALAPTTAFGVFRKAAATTGGLSIQGYSEDEWGLQCHGFATNATTTKSTAAQGAVLIAGALRSGTGVTDLTANANVAVVRNNGTTRFILDADGDSHQDVGTAWTNFDDHPDIELLHALSVGVSRMDDPIRAQFGQYLEQHRETLSRHRVVTFNPDGHHFINWPRTHMLAIGAIRMMGEELGRMRLALASAEQRLARIGA